MASGAARSMLLRECRSSEPLPHAPPHAGQLWQLELQKGERTPAIRYSAALQRAVHAPITGSQHPDGRRFAGTRWRVQRSMLATCCAALHSCGRLGTSRFNSRSFTKGVAIHERRSARTHFNSPSMHALNAHSERGVGGPGRLGLVSDVGRGHQGRSAATGSRTPPAGPPCDGPVNVKVFVRRGCSGRILSATSRLPEPESGLKVSKAKHQNIYGPGTEARMSAVP
jgi:hypothetical protein